MNWIMGYMLDTSVFNWILTGDYTIEELPYDGGVFITPVQEIELQKTGIKNPERMNNLIGVMTTVGPIEVPTSTGVVGPSTVIGRFNIGDGIVYEAIKNKMKALDPKRDHTNDALIAETALANNWTLISADADLCEAFSSMGGLTKVLSKSPK
jgi:hypothetical protein